MKTPERILKLGPLELWGTKRDKPLNYELVIAWENLKNEFYNALRIPDIVEWLNKKLT